MVEYYKLVAAGVDYSDRRYKGLATTDSSGSPASFHTHMGGLGNWLVGLGQGFPVLPVPFAVACGSRALRMAEPSRGPLSHARLAATGPCRSRSWASAMAIAGRDAADLSRACDPPITVRDRGGDLLSLPLCRDLSGKCASGLVRTVFPPGGSCLQWPAVAPSPGAIHAPCVRHASGGRRGSGDPLFPRYGAI